jgi:hypothetical protein
MKLFIKIIIAFFLLCVIFVFLFVFNSSRPQSYVSNPINGIVINAKTKQPLEGVVVFAIWTEYGGYHSHVIDEFEVGEAVTNENGEFLIPKWGVKKSKNWSAMLPIDEPYVYAYKYGFLPTHIRNESDPEKFQFYHRSEINWHGSRMIELTSVEDVAIDDKEMLSKLRDITPYLHGSCRWRKLVNLLVEIDLQMEDIERRASSEENSALPWYMLDQKGILQAKCSGAVPLLTKFRQSRIRKAL